MKMSLIMRKREESRHQYGVTLFPGQSWKIIVSEKATERTDKRWIQPLHIWHSSHWVQELYFL